VTYLENRFSLLLHPLRGALRTRGMSFDRHATRSLCATAFFVFFAALCLAVGADTVLPTTIAANVTYTALGNP
jgi:hypothetical protein